MCSLRMTVDTVAAERLLRDDVDFTVDHKGNRVQVPTIESLLDDGLLTYEELAECAGALARVDFEAVVDEEST